MRYDSRMIYSSEILILFSGLIVGVIIFQSLIIAPTVFKVLEVDKAGIFLRRVFPRFFILIMVCSALMLILVALSGSSDKTRFILPAANLVFSGVSYLVIPATNRARDDGEERKFKILHSLTVVLTLLMLMLNIAWWLV